MSQKERRTGMSDVSEKLGYISGRLDSLHTKVDDQQKGIKANADKVAHVEKKVDRHRNIATGAGTVIISAWTFLIIQWEKIKHFFIGAGS